ncbi:butyrophilin-like protein 2 [Thunnus thynnus]|uniref:butyrophilin-like protein 2 n=1 Tax=Thunnus thynnus TaxID=8237 RepID=UPI0035299B11
MICRILLFISLTSCVCATCVLDVTKTPYPAEENNNITLEWIFSTKPNSSSTSLNITCKLLPDVKIPTPPVLYHLSDGVEVSESQDVKFAGRVQCDKDALSKGRIRLHVSRLRTDDSGLYMCTVGTDDEKSSGRCRLSVTAAVEQSKPQPESRGRIGLYVGLTAAVLLAVCAGLYFAFTLRSNPDERR